MSDDKETYVHVSRRHKREDIPDAAPADNKCPKCGTELESGFGMAGGGFGVYTYCPNESCNAGITSKVEIEE